MLSAAAANEFRACIHCGLCLENCPTYVQLGVEMDSPRGRIVLMRGVMDSTIESSAHVRLHIDQCLGCRACESACPSGVQYAHLLERFRAQERYRVGHSSRFLDYLLYSVFPDRRRLGRWLALGRMSRAIGFDALVDELGLRRLLPAWLRQLEAMLPEHPPQVEPLRTMYHATGAARGSVALFIGCIGEAMFGGTNRATVRVLNRNGLEVSCPIEQVCCGAIHAHGGRMSDARNLARRNIAAFGGDDPIVTNIAGCGAMLKEYGRILADDEGFAGPAADFSRRVRDISECLSGLSVSPPPASLNARVTYHDPCHLCHAQGIRREPRDLLRSIPGLELVELAESELCCGAAGTYNLTQPELSRELAERKLARIAETGASIVATGNAGCILQLRAAALRAGRAIEVVHPIELLDRAYGGP